MGLSWQQGPLGRNPNGTFLTTTPMPARVLYLEPIRRRMSVELGGSTVARSDDAILLFEPARYPVAYFPLTDVAADVLQPSDHETRHPDLGTTKWFDVVGGDGQRAQRCAWQHIEPPDIVADALELVAGQTFCPYKGLASYYDIGDIKNAAWSYRAPFEEVERIADLVSFYPEKVTITIDDEKLEAIPGQNVLAHGPDRNLSVDEIGGIQLVVDQVAAEA
jgi:uncharacterized protein (DUF427 family)